MQIYWPYSTNWNGTNKPIILYGLDNNEQACKPVLLADGGFRVDTISITTEFVKENTVWVVSKNDTPYDELPNFENGEFVNKDGIFYYSKYANEVLAKNFWFQFSLYMKNMMKLFLK